MGSTEQPRALTAGCCHPWHPFRLFTLCARIHALDALKAAFRAYIKKAGLALIMDEEKVGCAQSCFSVPRPHQESKPCQSPVL